MNYAHEFYNHEKRCLADGVKPLTWAQFCRIACQIEAAATPKVN